MPHQLLGELSMSHQLVGQLAGGLQSEQHHRVGEQEVLEQVGDQAAAALRVTAHRQLTTRQDTKRSVTHNVNLITEEFDSYHVTDAFWAQTDECLGGSTNCPFPKQITNKTHFLMLFGFSVM